MITDTIPRFETAFPKHLENRIGIFHSCPGEIMAAVDFDMSIKILVAEIVGAVLKSEDPEPEMIDDLSNAMKTFLRSAAIEGKGWYADLLTQKDLNDVMAAQNQRMEQLFEDGLR